MSAQHSVRRFHQAFGLPVSDKPIVPLEDALARREALIREEAKETLAELITMRRLRPRMTEHESIAALAGEMADLMIVLYGTAIEFGFDLDLAFYAKLGEQMTKLEPCGECDGGEDSMDCPRCRGFGGTPVMREDGKVLKGSAFERADIADAIGLGPSPSWAS